MACGSVGQRAIASSYTNEDELMDQVLHPSPSGAMETAHYLGTTAHSDIRSRDDGRACFQPSSNRFPPITPQVTRLSDTGAPFQPPSFPFGPVTLTMLTLLRGDTLRREPEPPPAVATADGSPPATRDNNWRCETAAAAPIFNKDVAPSNSMGGTRVATSRSTLLAQTPEAQAAEPQPQARAPKIQRTDRRLFGDLRGFSRTVHSAPAGGEIPPLPPLPYLPRISGGGSAQGGDHVRQPAAVVAMVGRQQAASPTYGSTNPTGGAPQPPPPQSGWQPQELPSAAEGVAPTIEAAAVTLRGDSTAAMPVSTARNNLFGGVGGASTYARASLPPSQSWPGQRAAEYDVGSWCTAAAAAEPVQLDPNAGGTPYAPSTRAADVATADPNAAASAALPGGLHSSLLTNDSVDAHSFAAAAVDVAARTTHCAPAAPLRGAMPLQLSLPPPLRPPSLPPPVQVQVASRCRRGADKSTAARGRVTRGAVGVFHPRMYLGGGDCIECGSEMMSRGRFERLAGTATAKWHVSIKVLPSGMTLGRWLKQHGLPILQGRPRRRRFASEDGEEEEEQDEVEVNADVEMDADAAIEPTAAAAAAVAAAATNARSDDTSPLLQLHPTPSPPPLPPLCAPSPPPIFPVQSSPGGPSPSSVGAAATTATAAPSLPATASAAAIFAPAAVAGGDRGKRQSDASLMDLLQSSGILDDIYSMNERPTGQSAGAAPPCGYPVASASSLPTPPLPSTQAPAAPSLQPSARASAAGSVAPLSELQEGNMYGSRRSVSGARQVPDQDPYATVPWAGCGGSEGPFSTAAAAAMVSSMGGGCGGGTLLSGSGNGSAGGSSNGGGGKSDSGRGVGLDPCASAHSFSASTQDAASRTAIGVPPPSADATYGNNSIGTNSAGCGVPSAAAAAATTCDASAGGGPFGGDGGNEANRWQLNEQLGWCRAYSSTATSVGAAVTVAVPGLSSSGGGKYAAAAAANQHGPHLTALQQQQQQPAPQPPDWPPPPPPLQQQQQQQPQQPHLVPLAPGRCVLKGRERAASNSSSTAHPPPPPQPPLQLPPPHPVSQQLEQPQPSLLLPYQSQRPNHHHHHLPQSPAQSPNHHPGGLNHYHPQFHQHHHHPPYSPYSPYQSYQYPPRLRHYQQQQLRHHPYELSPSRVLQQQRYDVRHGVRRGVQHAVHPEAAPEAWRQHHQQQHSYAAAAARSVGGGADGSPRRPFKVYDRPSLGCTWRAIGWARSQPEPQGPRAPAPLFSPPVPESTFPPQLLASWEGDGGGGSIGGGGGDAGGGWRGHEQ